MKKSLREYFSDYAILLLIAGLVIALDQVTKYLVRTRLQYGEVWAPQMWMLDYARIVHWSNTGAAFGIFQNFGGVFLILAVIVSIAILYYYPRVGREDWPLRLAMGLQLGGAIGNLIDRLIHKSVTDFISIGSFAIFNIADASISLGVVVLVVGLWYKDIQEKRSSLALNPASVEVDRAQAIDSPASTPPEEMHGE